MKGVQGGGIEFLTDADVLEALRRILGSRDFRADPSLPPLQGGAKPKISLREFLSEAVVLFTGPCARAAAAARIRNNKSNHPDWYDVVFGVNSRELGPHAKDCA